MKVNYDFSKSKKNPYTKILTKQITLQIDVDTLKYFKELAEEKGVPCQDLISFYLADCASSKRKIVMPWE